MKDYGDLYHFNIIIYEMHITILFKLCIFSGNLVHGGGPNCLLGNSSQLLAGDGQVPPPAHTKPSLKSSSSKFKQRKCLLWNVKVL